MEKNSHLVRVFLSCLPHPLNSIFRVHFPNSQGNNITGITEQIQKNLKNIHSIAYLNQQNEYSYLPIKDFQIISSLERKIVLVFSVDKLDLPALPNLACQTVRN